MIHAVETGESVSHERRRELPESDQWLQVIFTQLENGVLLTASDITSRKRLESELEQARGQQAGTFHNTIDGGDRLLCRA